MPLCSNCNEDLTSAAFTKSQLQRARRNNAVPTCKSCQDLPSKQDQILSEGTRTVIPDHADASDKGQKSVEQANTDVPAHAGVLDNAPKSAEQPATNAFSIKDIPGKGSGVVASCPIVCGTLLVLEAPLAVGDGPGWSAAAQQVQQKMASKPSHSTEEAWEWKKAAYDRLLQDLFASLPADKQSAVMELHDCYQAPSAEKTLAGIWFTNSLPRGPDENVGMLCPTVSRFNSSCKPNTMYSWVEGLGAQQVRAIRNIEAGEELCVCYIDPRDTTAARQHELAKFNFTCTCETCLAADPNSDSNRARIQKLDEAVGRCGVTHPDLALKLVEELVALHEAECLTIPQYMARLMNDAFQISVAAGKPKAVVKGYAEKAYKPLVVGYGTQYEVARMMKRFVDNPPRTPQEMVRVQMEIMGDNFSIF